MAEQLTVTIVGKDGVSRVFKAIADGATKMGDAVEKVGADGKKGMDDLGRSAEANAQKMERARAEATAIGAVMGVLAAGVMQAGAAYRDQERQIDGINRLYGDQADVILEVSERIQDFTRYNNDAARESALVASSLATNYDLTAEQIGVLIERSADLAQIHGVDLVDAVTRTAGAIRGEGEAAERLGLNMSDAAIAARALEAGITDWNVPGALSEAEKAMFRFQVFMEDTQATVGAAADAADNAGGRFRGFLNTMQDGVQVLGGWLGPLGQIGAEMAPLAIAAPVVAGGIGRMTAALRGSSIAASAMGLALNPITVALGAIVGVGAIVAENYRRQGEAAENYTASLVTLGDTLEWLRLQGDEALADLGEDLMNQVDLSVANETIDKALDAYERLDLAREGIDPTTFSNILAQDFNAAIDMADDVNLRISEALSNPNIDHEAYIDWVSQMLGTIRTTAEGSNVDEVFEEILTRPLSDFREEADASVAEMERITASAAELMEVFSDFPTMLDDLRIEGQGGLANDLETLHESIVDAFSLSDQEVAAANAAYLRSLPAEDAEAAIQHMTQQTDLSVESTERLGEAWDRVSDAMATGNLDNAALMADVQAILEDTTLTAEEQAAAIIDLSSNLSQYVDQFAGLKAMMVDWIADSGNFLEFWQQLDQVVLDSAGGIAQASDAWLQFRETVDIASEIDAANQSFDQVLRTFDQIDQLASRPSKAGSIVEALVGAPGEWAAIDDLLESGRIGLEQYYAVVESGYAITDSVARSQLTLNEIRADQLPLLEAEQAAYEANLEAIAALGPAEQRRVLMLQDQAVQTQIATLYSQAYAASIGEIPEEVATQMILNAAEADAGLKDLLLNLGLISETDGEIRVNFPDADSTVEAIDRVTGSVLLLADILDGGGLDGSIKLTIEGDEELNELYGHLIEVDGTEVEATVTADTVSAEERAAYILDVWTGLDGTTATTTVQGVDDASDEVANVDAVLAALDGSTATVTNIGVDNASDEINAVRSNLQDLAGDSATVYINAINNAGGVLGSVASQLAALDGASATSYVDTVYRTIGTRPFAHGGIVAMPEFAEGGMVPFRAGEAGLEVAHFATGGMAPLPYDGYYAAQPGTYISPAPASVGKVRGEINLGGIHIHGNVYGIEDLTEKVMREMAPALRAAMHEWERGMGAI